MGYGPPPWLFKGQALYQLSLVKVEEARRYVPPELPLVSLFGWTLGGFYLARYSASPVGAFDELVALGGLVWDPPASCAWAARVYVSDRDARDHGVKSVGLPSRLASFRALPPLPAVGPGGGGGGRAKGSRLLKQHECSWWDTAGAGGAGARCTGSPPTAEVELLNSEARGLRSQLARLLPWRRRRGRLCTGLASPVASFEVPPWRTAWAPRVQMFLPSFSGATPDFPSLLKYSLRLMAHVRVVAPLRVRLPATRPTREESSAEVMDAVLGGRPLLCLSFEDMQMDVEEPQPWTPMEKPSLRRLAPS